MKVLLIDDHPLILAALTTMIQDLGADVVVTGADSADAARATLRQNAAFDLVLLDLHLDKDDGFALLAELRSTHPELPVVIVSASDRTSDVIRSIDMGAMGFVPKRASTAVLQEALRLVMAGGIYVPPMTLGVDGPPATQQPDSSEADTTPGYLKVVGTQSAQEDHPTAPTLEALGLTPRQTAVLALLLQGKPNKLIARELNLSGETVKDHVAAVLRALGVNSRTQAVLTVSQMTQQAGGIGAWRNTEL